MKRGDTAAAFSYFQKAAEQGYSKAQYNVGLCHEHGRGAPQDIRKVLISFYPLAHPPEKPPEMGCEQGWESQAFSPSAEGKAEKTLPTLGNLGSGLGKGVGM